MGCFNIPPVEKSIENIRDDLGKLDNRKKIFKTIKNLDTLQDGHVSRKEFRIALSKTLNIKNCDSSIDEIFNKDILDGKSHGEIAHTELKKMWFNM